MTQPSPWDKGLDFQVTDFGEARKALDDLPPGVAEVQQMDPGYWQRRRRPQGAADRALTSTTMEWLIRLPAEVQPRRASTSMPRLINQVAGAAHDPDDAVAAIEALFNDRRGGRRGLPEPVQIEMKRLLEHFRVQAERKRQRSDPAEIERARRLLESAGYRVIPPAG